jgi:hypothetical protein
MPLILPQHLAQFARPKAPPVKMGVFLTLEQLGGIKATTADLMAELVKLKRSDVIRWVAAISVRLAEPNGMAHERQREMARQLLREDLIAGLNKWLQHRERVPPACAHWRTRFPSNRP